MEDKKKCSELGTEPQTYSLSKVYIATQVAHPTLLVKSISRHKLHTDEFIPNV